MANLNKVMLIGNVTRDPEVKYTPKGSAVADVGLAINRSYTNQGGEKVEEVTYVDVELWGRLAEIAGEYAKKGRPIFIEGRLRIDSWEPFKGRWRRVAASWWATRRRLGPGDGGGSRGRGCDSKVRAAVASSTCSIGTGRRRYSILIGPFRFADLPRARHAALRVARR
jgi:single-strand DNA-binding protein